jgi:aminoglycoside 6'-N-acetyltransferase
VIRLMMDYLFGECGADRITMDPVTTNLRAIRAYEKCGFTKRKLLPQQELHEGTDCDCWLMEAVRRPLTPRW